MSNSTDFIEACLKDHPVSAMNSFDAMIQDKIESRLTAKAEEVRADLFGESTDKG